MTFQTHEQKHNFLRHIQQLLNGSQNNVWFSAFMENAITEGREKTTQTEEPGMKGRVEENLLE